MKISNQMELSGKLSNLDKKNLCLDMSNIDQLLNDTY